MKFPIFMKILIFIPIFGTFFLITWNGKLSLSFKKHYFASTTTLFHTLLRHNSSLMADKLGNFTEFKFLLENKEFCGNESVFMLIFVGSAPKNSLIRNMYRRALFNVSKTYPKINFKMLFPFGAFLNQTQQNILGEEIARYHDIIQGNFLDSYRNITLRDLMSLRWAWKHCSQTKYIMHLDDDIVFKISDVMEVLEQHCKHFPVFIGCYQVLNKTRGNNVIYRDGHYGLSKEEYPENKFPDYCEGKMYVLSPLMAYLLDQTALEARQYWMNDAYITGTLIEKLNFIHIDLHLEPNQKQHDQRNMLN